MVHRACRPPDWKNDHRRRDHGVRDSVLRQPIAHHGGPGWGAMVYRRQQDRTNHDRRLGDRVSPPRWPVPFRSMPHRKRDRDHGGAGWRIMVYGAWFTEPFSYIDGGDLLCLGTQAIGRITTTGVITVFALPYMGIGTGVACQDVGSIVAGPDGALWFNTGGNTAIGRITTDGVFTKYDITPPPQGPVRAST